MDHFMLNLDFFRVKLDPGMKEKHLVKGVLDGTSSEFHNFLCSSLGHCSGIVPFFRFHGQAWLQLSHPGLKGRVGVLKLFGSLFNFLNLGLSSLLSIQGFSWVFLEDSNSFSALPRAMAVGSKAFWAFSIFFFASSRSSQAWSLPALSLQEECNKHKWVYLIYPITPPPTIGFWLTCYTLFSINPTRSDPYWPTFIHTSKGSSKYAS